MHCTFLTDIRILIIVSCYIKVLEIRWNETHDRLSRIMMPGADPKVIYRVNRAMDNPDPWSIYLNQYMKKSGHAPPSISLACANTGTESLNILDVYAMMEIRQMISEGHSHKE
jgi:hypothetical protein